HQNDNLDLLKSPFDRYGIIKVSIDDLDTSASQRPGSRIVDISSDCTNREAAEKNRVINQIRYNGRALLAQGPENTNFRCRNWQLKSTSTMFLFPQATSETISF